MTANTIQRAARAAVVMLAIAASGCGQYVRDQGRSPSQVVITSLEAASGANPSQFSTPLLSDVITLRTKPDPCTSTSPCPTIYDDFGQVTMELILKDPGQAGTQATPTSLNQVTFNRYHVAYQRADGRNTPGVDVPYGFDGAVTFTVPASGTVSVPFELVRHAAKQEAPLLALATSADTVTTIATVTFYGQDQAGNGVTVIGTIQVNFGNFADLQS